MTHNKGFLRGSLSLCSKTERRKAMPAYLESMFYVREAPWHGLGVCVEEALSSDEALEKSGLDWRVIQRQLLTDTYDPVPGYKVNIRDRDNRILGVVSDRYKTVQNHEAFAFVDDLLGEGVRFETAGALHDGKKVWMLAKLPNRYTMMEEEIEPYLVFSNSHDGNSSIRAAMTPIRVVCQNTFPQYPYTALRLHRYVCRKISKIYAQAGLCRRNQPSGRIGGKLELL
jgi:hypothetical protein